MHKRVTFQGRLLPYLLLAPQIAVTLVFLWMVRAFLLPVFWAAAPAGRAIPGAPRRS